MAEYDITAKLVPNLNRQLIFPILDFLESSGINSEKETLEAKYELFKDSNLASYLLNVKKELDGGKEVDDSETKRLQGKQEEVVSTLSELEAKAEPIMAQIADPTVVSNIRQDVAHNIEYFKTRGITDEQIKALYDLGSYQFSVGNYSVAADCLYHYRILSLDAKLVTKSYWGKLAAEILMTNWDIALEDLNALRDHIEERSSATSGAAARSGVHSASSHAEYVLEQRTWWLHWSLFVYFNHPGGFEALVTTWSSPNYQMTIQNNAPWLLRYYVAALILVRRARIADGVGLSHRFREQLREAVRTVVQEEVNFSDPITQFLRKVLYDVDFSVARLEIPKCKPVIQRDFFLDAYANDFTDASRHLLGETFCRVHDRVSIGDLASQLDLSAEEGERWIVDLVRDTRLDAKIDFEKGVVQMNHYKSQIQQSVIDRTKGLLFRTQAISAALDARASGTDSHPKGSRRQVHVAE